MNAEEVCAMMDAISDGREFEYINDSHSCMIVHPDEGVLFSADFDTSFEVVDSRTAREIAVALVAWADRKDKQ